MFPGPVGWVGRPPPIPSVPSSWTWLLLLLFSCWVLSDSLQPRGTAACQAPLSFAISGVCSDSCPLSQWCCSSWMWWHPANTDMIKASTASAIPASFLQGRSLSRSSLTTSTREASFSFSYDQSVLGVGGLCFWSGHHRQCWSGVWLVEAESRDSVFLSPIWGEILELLASECLSLCLQRQLSVPPFKKKSQSLMEARP